MIPEYIEPPAISEEIGLPSMKNTTVSVKLGEIESPPPEKAIGYISDA
jgi:hypothetical protein